MGRILRQAILEGSAEIALPALVSTLSICIVFLPMAFLSGVARSLFLPLAEAVIFAMLASYLLSRTVTPTFAMFLLPKEVALFAEEGHEEQSGSDEQRRTGTARTGTATTASTRQDGLAPDGRTNGTARTAAARTAHGSRRADRRAEGRREAEKRHRLAHPRGLQQALREDAGGLQRPADLGDGPSAGRQPAVPASSAPSRSACTRSSGATSSRRWTPASSGSMSASRPRRGWKRPLGSSARSRTRSARRSPPPRPALVLDNIGEPIFVNLAYGDSATVGPSDGEILVTLKPKHHADGAVCRGPAAEPAEAVPGGDVLLPARRHRQPDPELRPARPD